jgi:hypothetical protein
MSNPSEFSSTTGAANARLLLLDHRRPMIVVAVPVGSGRRLRIELGIGQARAVQEALGLALEAVDKRLGAG